MADDEPTGDALRSLELLWGRRKTPTRGPKPGLSVERIVRAAIEVADARGLEALSMRAVADALGVGTMSLYRYVPTKAELLELMREAAVAEPPLPDRNASWRAQLEHCAREGMALYRRHPWMLRVSFSRPPLGPNTLGQFDAVLQSVQGTGLSPADMLSAVALVDAYVRGSAQTVVERAQVIAQSGVSDEEWWGEREVFWEEYFEPERFPGLTYVWEHGGYEADPDTYWFEFGLARVLDGLEAFLAREADLPPSET